MRPDGICTKVFHGLHCAYIPINERPLGREFILEAIPPSDYQTQEVRNLVRRGYWIASVPSTLDGQITGSFVLFRFAD